VARAEAVCNRDGDTVRLMVPLHDSKNAHLVSPDRVIPPDPDRGRFSLHEVLVVTLDEAVPGQADFLNIDVEGAEEAVWRGTLRLIARNPRIKILLEFNPHRCENPRGLLAEMAALFPLREVNFDGHAVPCSRAAYWRGARKRCCISPRPTPPKPHAGRRHAVQSSRRRRVHPHIL